MSIRFYFDFVSPYAWVAWRPARALAARHGRTLDPVPVLFAGILDAHGQLGPAEIPAKRAYIYKDAYRKCIARGLPPLAMPPAHPFHPLAALRAATATLASSPSRAFDLIDALFSAAWVDGRAIDDAEAVSGVASGAGLDGPEIVRAAAETTTKESLRRATADAVGRGVFGVPTFEVAAPSVGSVGSVGTELFWGSDAIEHVDAFLRGEDPLPKDARYFERPASAARNPNKVDRRRST